MGACEAIQQQLGELIDDGLDLDQRAIVQAHVATCAACAGLLADFEQLREVARALGPIAPPDRVWAAVAEVRGAAGPHTVGLVRGAAGLQTGGLVRGAAGLQTGGLDRSEDQPLREPLGFISRDRPTSRSLGAGWTWLAAAAAFVICAIGASWHWRPLPAATPVTASNVAPGDSVEVVTDEMRRLLAPYNDEIALLERTAPDPGGLDPVVAEAVRHSLGVVDLAIAESRVALASDPEDTALRAGLFDALDHKIRVLEARVSLIGQMSHMSHAEADGAPRAADGTGRQS